MKKLTLLAITAVLMIAGCGNQAPDKATQVENKNQENVVNNIVQDIEEDLGDNINETKSTKKDCMDGCAIMWNSNPGNKDRSQEDMAKDCNSLCDAAQGMENNDVSQCEKAEGMMRDSCFTDIAQDLNQPELCGKIAETMIRNGCYSSLAENNKDLSICDNITDPMWNGICKESVQNVEE